MKGGIKMDEEALYELLEEPDISKEDMKGAAIRQGNKEVEELETGVDWGYVKSELKDSEWFENCNGDKERYVFLGTVFALTPSGKYYTAWANSNVEPCPICEGSGNDGEETCNICGGEGKRGIHPDDDISNFNLINKGEECCGCQGSGLQNMTCEYCEGCGSREAFLDQIFWEKLEEEADEHGLFITSGEGDPCDVLAGEIREMEEDEGGELL